MTLQPLGSLISVTKGKRPSSLQEEPADDMIPYIDLAALEHGTRRKYASRGDSRVVPAGTLAMVWDGARSGWTGITQFEGALGSTLAALDSDLDRQFLYWFLTAHFRTINLNPRGSGLPHVNPDVLQSLLVPDVSLETQRSLAKLIEEVTTRSRTASASLDAARSSLQRFRQAIYAQATQGLLTEDWRTANGGPSDGKPTAALEGSLPLGWRHCTIADVGDVYVGGTPRRSEASYWNGDVPWVSSGEVANTRISETRELITREGLSGSSAKLHPPGSVLIAMIGEGKTRGQSAILDIEASTNQNVAAIVPNRDIVDPEYLWRWALGHYQATRAAGRGGNQPALNKQRVRNLPVPVPPIEEQQEIAGRLDELVAVVESIEASIDEIDRRVSDTGRSVVGRALVGVADE